MSQLLLATEIVRRLTQAGHIAYFAGGWVRDFLMNHPSDDIDIATSASPQQVSALFPKTIPIGIAFGIIIVVEGGHQFEVATFRKDGPSLDGRRPESTTFAAPEEDAQRRDFTINGLFYDPLSKTLYDYVEGQKDLEKGLIRAIGDPYERFLEDRLRMIRAVRYSTRFNFPIETATENAIREEAKNLFPSVAIERVWLEFKKMSQFFHLDRALVKLHRLNLLSTIFPEMALLSLDDVKARVQVIPKFPPNSPTIAQLLELFPDASLDKLMSLCEYLKLSNHDKDLVQFIHHARTLLKMPKSWQEKVELLEWAKFYTSPHTSLILDIMGAHMKDEEQTAFSQEHQDRRQLLERSIKRLQTHKPVVQAKHLLQEGMTAGKQLGLLLKEAERLSVNLQLDDPQEIIYLLKKSPMWRSS